MKNETLAAQIKHLKDQNEYLQTLLDSREIGVARGAHTHAKELVRLHEIIAGQALLISIFIEEKINAKPKL